MIFLFLPLPSPHPNLCLSTIKMIKASICLQLHFPPWDCSFWSLYCKKLKLCWGKKNRKCLGQRSEDANMKLKKQARSRVRILCVAEVKFNKGNIKCS